MQLILTSEKISFELRTYLVLNTILSSTSIFKTCAVSYYLKWVTTSWTHTICKEYLAAELFLVMIWIRPGLNPV